METRAKFLAGRRILVTGGTGHLGSALVHHLVMDLGVAPAAVRVFYLAGSPTRSLRDIDGLDHAPGDILDPADVERACAGVDYVFHMAGSTSFDPRAKRLQWLINVEGTRFVLEAARRSPTVKRVCYTSTVNALGVPDPPGSLGSLATSDPYTNRPRLHTFDSPEETLAFIEEVRADPDSRWERRLGLGYFDSKLAAQELVQSYARDGWLDVVSVLPGTCFGPHASPAGNGVYILRIFQGRMPGVLPGGFSAAHVMDVVEGHVLAMTTTAAAGSRYIITGRAEDNLRLAEVAATITEVLRKRFPGRKIKRPSLVIPPWLAWPAALASEFASALTGKSCLLSRAAVKAGSQPLFYSCEEAARDLGYRPKRTFRQAVEDMAAYFDREKLFGPRA